MSTTSTQKISQVAEQEREGQSPLKIFTVISESVKDTGPKGD